jgi:subtilisin family serine protease
VARRAAILLDKRNAKFTLEELIEDINSGKRNGVLKKLVGNPVTASRFYYRAPTPFEIKLMETDTDGPLAKLHQYVIVEYADSAAREAAIESIKRDRSFLHVVRDAVTAHSALPSEATSSPTWLGTSASIGKQWGMHKLGFAETPAVGVSPAKPGGWDKSRGRAFVGIVDNGIETIHSDLIKNYRHHLSFNFYTKTYFDEPDELIFPYFGAAGHGTHVASTIAASHNDGGTAGGCPECSLVILREFGSLTAQATAIARAVDTGVQVLNMSFESEPQDRYDCAAANALDVFCLVLTHASNNGVSLVAAAGNQGNIQNFSTSAIPHADLWNVPAVHPNVLAVSGLQFDGTNANFWTGGPGGGAASGYFGSNFGAMINGVPQISFAAPAKDVLASVYHGQTWNAICGDTANAPNAAVTTPNTDGVGLCTGTSMAAPHISAMAGLVKSANPLLDTAGVKSVLIQASECLEGNLLAPCTATTPLNGVAGDAMKKLGYGVPKADKAVQIALGGPSAVNRMTPLFANYSTQGHSHFYTTNPQMVISAMRGTLQPSPRYKFDPVNVNCSLTPAKCTNLPLFLDQGFTTRLPDGTLQSANSISTVFEATSTALTAPLRPNVTLQNAAGTNYLPQNTNALPILRTATGFAGDALIPSNAVLTPLAISEFPLSYPAIGLPIPGYPNLPCGPYVVGNPSTFCTYWEPKAIAMLLTTHANPVNASQPLKPIYRLSCAAEASCNLSNETATKPFHITFRYVNNLPDVNVLTSGSGTNTYKLDGIEGYVFTIGTGFPQPSGTKKLCSKRDANSNDYILFLENTPYPLGNGSFGTTGTCATTTTDYMAGGASYLIDAVELGYAYPVDRPKALPDQPLPAAQSFNGDQYSDIFWINDVTQATAVWQQNGYTTTSTAAATGQTTDASWKVAAIADFDGDGMADILWRGVSGANLGKTKLWIMNGSTVISSTDIGIPSQTPLIVTDYEIAGVGDFNGDGSADILWRSTTSGYHVMWFMQGASIMNNSSVPVGTVTPSWKVAGVADLNGDGKADILWRNSASNDIASWIMNGAQISAQQSVQGGVDPNWVIKAVADVTGDGHADVVWYHGLTGSVAVWKLVNGLYNTGVSLGSGVIEAWQIVGVRDFDGDKKADILWRHSTGTNAIWLIDGLSIKGQAGINAQPVGWTVQPAIP